MNLPDFLANVAVPALVSGGTAWLLLQFLGEKIVSHRLSKDLERYKVELAEKTDVLKTQLAIFSHEQNVATSRIDTQRSEAIHKVYACVRAVINPVTSVVAGTPIVNGTAEQSISFYIDNAETAHAACGKLVHTLSDLAIYFDNETYKSIMRFAEVSMNGVALYLQDLRRLSAEGADGISLLAAAERNRENLTKVQSESIHPLASRLTGIFRDQLGIEKTRRPSAQ